MIDIKMTNKPQLLKKVNLIKRERISLITKYGDKLINKNYSGDQ